MTITIYHNPNCSTSRSVLAMIRESGAEPVIVEYLKAPPSRETLEAIITAAGISAHALLREKEAVFAELDLADPSKTDTQRIDAIVQHPVLLQRPIVVTPLGTRVCRPAESVREILPRR